ncbi:MAG: hypothetical protein GKR91_19385 [Pseudomonadales bacterium]|nr:hypothetical protein [Pseudomonadales bacterium]
MNTFFTTMRLATRSQIQRTFVLVVSIALTLAPIQGVAQTDSNENDNPAGHIIVVSGEVVARDTAGSARELRRRSSIFVGDTIFTSASASAQMRMADQAIISLKESTEFAIVAYQYEEDPETDVSALELIEGGFRTITGAIGEQNRDSYVTTIGQLATIGIRGTDYEVVITPQGEIFTGVYEGGTNIANAVGDLDLGLGADYDFGLVPDAETPPEGLIARPGELGAIAISIAPESDDEDAQDGDGGDDADGATDDADDQATDGNSSDDQATDEDAANAASDSTDNSDNTAADAGNDGADSAVAGTAAPANADDADDSSSLSLAANATGTDAEVDLAPPSSTQLAETPNTIVADTVDNSGEQAQSSDPVVNPSETGGNGSIACNAGSASCTVLDKILESTPSLAEAPEDEFSDAGNNVLNVNSLNEKQVAFLKALDLAPDTDSGTIDIGSLGKEQIVALRALASSEGDGNSGGGIAGATLQLADLTADQVTFLRSLGLVSDDDGIINIGSLNEAQLERLKTLGEVLNDDEPPSGGSSTVNVGDLTDGQIEFLRSLGLAADNGTIDISQLSTEQLERLKALATDIDSTPPDGGSNGDPVLIDVTRLSGAQVEFLKSLGLAAENGFVDIGQLNEEQLKRLESLAEDSGPDNDIPLPDDLVVAVDDLSAGQAEFLRSLGLSAQDGFIDISKLNEEQLKKFVSLSDGTGPDNDLPFPDDLLLDVSDLSEEQIDFLRSLGLTAEDGSIDISKLDEEQLKRLESLGGDTGSGGDTPPPGTATINVSDLSDAQIDFLKSLGLTAKDGLVDVSGLSDEQIERLKSLGDEIGTGNDIPPATNPIDITNLSEEQIEFLKSLGLTVQDGVIDIGGLSDEQIERFKSLADSSGSGGDTPTATNPINVANLTDAQIEFLKSLGLTAKDGIIDIGGLSDEQIERLKSLADSGGNGGGTPPPVNTIPVANLSDEQIEFLKSLGLSAKDGVVDISGLDDEQLKRLSSLGDKVETDTPPSDSETVKVSALSKEQIEFLKSLGLTEKDGVIDISGLSDEERKKLEELAANANLSLPVRTIDTGSVSWGKWDKPLDTNWVVVQEIDNGLQRISTNDFFADVTPTPIANMSGSHNYRTGIASSFIATGSGGEVSSLVAGMEVNFDTGVIENGNLQVLAGNQSWTVDFDGFVQAGAVELNANSGQLFDNTGLLSNAIEANLDGVFTGDQAEAFVGGFDLLDAVNSHNTVNGIFTVER